MDDGAGFIAAWEAVRLLKILGISPRRTIRAVVWTNEETGRLSRLLCCCFLLFHVQSSLCVFCFRFWVVCICSLFFIIMVRLLVLLLYLLAVYCFLFAVCCLLRSRSVAYSQYLLSLPCRLCRRPPVLEGAVKSSGLSVRVSCQPQCRDRDRRRCFPATWHRYFIDSYFLCSHFLTLRPL